MFQWHEEAHFGAEERLRMLLLDSGVQAEVLVVADGDIPRSLSEAVKTVRAGLLVIGRSSASDRERRLGSQTYSIICNAPCPVVSLPAPALFEGRALFMPCWLKYLLPGSFDS